MANEQKIARIEKIVNHLLEPVKGYFLVQVSIKDGNNIDIVIDGDEGVAIDMCTKLSRAVGKQIEEDEMFPADDYALEVGSAGIGEPLLLHRQFEKNLGRFVEVKMKDGTTMEGELFEVDDESITVKIATGTGKKMMVKPTDFLFDNILTTIVQIKF